MLMSLEEERRRNGEAQHSNFVEIFKGSNLVGQHCMAETTLIAAALLDLRRNPLIRSAVW